MENDSKVIGLLKLTAREREILEYVAKAMITPKLLRNL